MRTTFVLRPLLPALAWCVLLTGCNAQSDAEDSATHVDEHAGEPTDEHTGHAPGHAEEPDTIHLSDEGIASAGITVEPVRRASAGTIEVPGTIIADPGRSSVVAASVAGRIAEVHRSIGEAVRKGDVLAVLESREAAEFTAEFEAARSQLTLATSTLKREERLFRERVTPEQDLLAARAQAREAQIRVRLAQQRLVAIGSGASAASNRLSLLAPRDGHVISREAALGDMVEASTVLFLIADLAVVSIELAVPPDSASALQAGDEVVAVTSSRKGNGVIAFVSPVLDLESRQVRATATLDNASGQWRVGEGVSARVLVADQSASALTVPKAALQMIEEKPSVFVRTREGFLVKHLSVGPVSGDAITVLEGLDGDEEVAVQNSFVLKAELGKGEGGEHEH